MKLHEHEYDSDESHDQKWKHQNLEEIDNLDDEIEMLEKKLGLKADKKRKERNNRQAE